MLAAAMLAGCLTTGLFTVPAYASPPSDPAAAHTQPSVSGNAILYSKPDGYRLPTGVSVDRDTKYHVTVNGEELGLYPAQVGLQADVDKKAKAAFGTFDQTGSVTVQVTTDFDFDTVTVRPLSLGIEPKVDGRTVTFTVDNPSNISVEFDDNLQENLHLFSSYPVQPDFSGMAVHEIQPGNHTAAELTEDFVDGKTNVLWFKPGVHILSAKDTLYLPSNTTVYVEGGSVVYGRLHAENADNIKILGRGVVSGAFLDRRADFGDGPESYLMRFLKCTNVEVNGIVLQDSPHWTFVNIECENVNVRDLRIVGQRRSNNDGMDIVNCRNFTVDHSFVRTIDDAITVKGKYIGGERNLVSDITVQNSVLWNEDSGNAQEIGFETLTERMQNITFRNNDVIHNHSGGTMTMHNGDSATISNVVNDDIRVETKTGGSLVEVFIRDTYYSTGLERGEIVGVTYNRIRYLPQDDRQSTINGYSEDVMVRNMTFSDVVVNGKQITGAYESGKAQFSYDSFCEAPVFTAQPTKFEPAAGILTEGETLTAALSEGTQSVAEFEMANAGQYLDMDLSQTGQAAAVQLDVPASAHYIPVINFKKGPDGGVFQILVDGVDHGYWLDTYCEDEIMQAYTLTSLYLTAGKHTITFRAAGSHADSQGMHLGLDYINLTAPVDITAQAEDHAAMLEDGQASMGRYGTLAVADGQAQLTVPVSTSRTSNLKIRLRTGPELGKMTLLLDGQPQGEAVDLYSETASFAEFSFGTATLEAGEHVFTFQLEGSASLLDVDYVKFGAFPDAILWRARRLYNNTYYASSGASTDVTGDTYDTDSIVTTHFAKQDDWARYTVTVPADGFYTVIGVMQAGPDKGAVSLTAQGVDYGTAEVDAYAAETSMQEYTFGAVYLTYGENDLQFNCTGKNAASTGYDFSLNAIKLLPGINTGAVEDSYVFVDTPTANYGAEDRLTVKDGGGGFVCLCRYPHRQLWCGGPPHRQGRRGLHRRRAQECVYQI